MQPILDEERERLERDVVEAAMAWLDTDGDTVQAKVDTLEVACVALSQFRARQVTR